MAPFTSKEIKLGLGGGFKYEWLVAAEIAVIALHPELRGVWLCEETETPIHHRYRQWLGIVRGLQFDSAERADTDRKPLLEDINIAGEQGRELLIQVKASEKLSSSEFLKALKAFVRKRAESRRFVLLHRNIVNGFHRHANLEDLLKDKKAKDIGKKLRKELQESCKAQGLNFRDEWKSFLDSVTFCHLPLAERSVTGLKEMLYRVLPLSTGLPRRRKILNRCASLVTFRIENFAVSQNALLTEDRLCELIEKPLLLKDLSNSDGFELPENENHHIFFLETLYGWELECHTGFLRRFIRCSLERWQNSRVERDLCRWFRDASSSPTYETKELPDDSAVRALVSLRRIIALLKGEVAGDLLEERARKGDFSTIAHIWLGRNPLVKQHHGMLTIDLPLPPHSREKLKQACNTLLRSFYEELREHKFPNFEIVFSIRDEQPPSWFPEGQKAEPEPRDNPEPLAQKSELESKARELANVIEEHQRGLRREIDLEVADSALQLAYERALRLGFSELARSARTVRAKVLDKLGKEREATEALLELALERVESRAEDVFAQHYLSRFEKAILEESDPCWLNLQLIKGHRALARANFDELYSILSKIDPDVAAPLIGERGERIFRLRLAEVAGTLAHWSPEESIAKGLQLISRIEKQSVACKYQLQSQLALAALWSEASEEFARVKQHLPNNELELALSLSGECEHRVELEATILTTTYLKYLMGSDQDRESVGLTWNILQSATTKHELWRKLQFMRPHLEFRRGLLRFDVEPSRLAAVEIGRVRVDLADRLFQKTTEEVSRHRWHAAFRELYRAELVALLRSNWVAWIELRKLRPRMWIEDGRFLQAALEFVRVGEPNDKALRRTLARHLPEGVMGDFLADGWKLKGAPRRQKFYELVLDNWHLLTSEQRQPFVVEAKRESRRLPDFREEVAAREALFALISQFLKCPSSHIEARQLVALLLEIYRTAKGEFERTEQLTKLRRGFWSATATKLPKEAAIDLLRALQVEVAQSASARERDAGYDIILAIGLTAKSGSEVESVSREVLEQAKAREYLAEWDARLKKPTDKEVTDALNKACKRAQERISADLNGASASINFHMVSDVRPFVQHMSLEQRGILLGHLLDAVEDPLTESTRRWDVMQLLREEALYRDLERLFRRAVDAVWTIVNGCSPENEFDTYRREVNETHLSGLTIESDQDKQLSEMSAQTLGVLCGLSCDNEKRFFRQLSTFLFSDRLKEFSLALTCYLEVGGSLEVSKILPLIDSLLTNPSAELRLVGLELLYKWLDRGGKLRKSTISALRVIIKIAANHKGHVALAKLSRLARTYPTKGVGSDLLISLNEKYRNDSNPIIRRQADSAFWGK